MPGRPVRRRRVVLSQSPVIVGGVVTGHTPRFPAVSLAEVAVGLAMAAYVVGVRAGYVGSRPSR